MANTRKTSVPLEGFLGQCAPTPDVVPGESGDNTMARVLMAVTGSALALSVSLTPSASADEDEPPRELATIGTVLESVGAEFPGQILNVELEDDDDARSGWAYEVKVLTSDGQVIEIKVDAVSIERLEIEGAHRQRSNGD